MVDPWIGPVVRATIAAFVHTSVPLMVLEYAHLPPSTAAAVHFVLLIAGSITVVMWGRNMGPNVTMILALVVVLNVPLWLAYGILHAGAVPSVQYPLMCALLLVALMGGAYLSLPGDLVGLLCVVLLVADTINMMLAASLGAKKVSMLVTLVFLMAIALAAVIVFVLNTLVLPSYATDEALCRHELVVEKLRHLVGTVLGAPPPGPSRQPAQAPSCAWFSQLGWCGGKRPQQQQQQQQQQEKKQQHPVELLPASGQQPAAAQEHGSKQDGNGSSRSSSHPVMWGLLGAIGLLDEAPNPENGTSSSSSSGSSGVEEAWWQLQTAVDGAVGAAAGTALELYCGRLGRLRLFVPALLPCCGLTTAQLPHTTLFLIRQTSRDAANTAQGLAALLGWPPSLMSPAASPGVTGDAAECAGVQPGAAGPSSKQGVGGGGWLEALGANPDWRQVVGSITTALEDMCQAAPLAYRTACPALTAAHLRSAHEALGRLEQQAVAVAAGGVGHVVAKAGIPEQQQHQQEQKAAARQRVLQQHWPAEPGAYHQELVHCNMVLVLLQLRRLLEQLTRLHDLVGQLRSHVAAGGGKEGLQQQRCSSVPKGEAEGQAQDTQHAGALSKGVDLLPVSSDGVGCSGQAVPSPEQEAVLLQPDTQWTDTLEGGLSHPLLHRY